MATIKFIEFDGTEHVVEGANDSSIMEAAVTNLVPGIDADCGGECSCATCHVLIDQVWRAKLDEPSEKSKSRYSVLSQIVIRRRGI